MTLARPAEAVEVIRALRRLGDAPPCEMPVVTAHFRHMLEVARRFATVRCAGVSNQPAVEADAT